MLSFNYYQIEIPSVRNKGKVTIFVVAFGLDYVKSSKSHNSNCLNTWLKIQNLKHFVK